MVYGINSEGKLQVVRDYAARSYRGRTPKNEMYYVTGSLEELKTWTSVPRRMYGIDVDKVLNQLRRKGVVS